MNRSLILLLLAASIAGNAALAFLVFRPSSASASAKSSAPTATTAGSSVAARAAVAAAPVSSVLTEEKIAAARNSGDFRAILGELRALGLSEPLVRAVMQALVSEEFMRRQREIFDYSSVPYWKMPRQTPEQQRAMRALSREQRALMEELGLPSWPREADHLMRQFGSLPPAKVAALRKVQDDYSDMRAELYEQQRTNPQVGRDLQAQIRLLQEEQQRDIAALLTPDELLEYEMRTSNTANQLRGQLRDLDLNEQEYRELFAAQKALEAKQPSNFTGPLGVPQLEAQYAGWEEFQTKARGVLGDDRYRQLLLSQWSGGPGATKFFNDRPNLSVDQLQAVARMARTIPIEVQREMGGPNISPDERRARLAALTAKYQAQAAQILGSQAGADLMTANVLPLPRIAPGGASGAIRIGG